MTEWRYTDNVPAVAVQFADRWATAVAAQARRIEHPEDLFERVSDEFLQVNALDNVLKAAEMAKRAVRSMVAKRKISEACTAFLSDIVVSTTLNDDRAALALARNVLQHFDAYYCGSGKHQARRSGSLDAEQLVRSYQLDIGGPSAGRPHLLIGERGSGAPIVSVDLVERAPLAARRLATSVGVAAGLK